MGLIANNLASGAPLTLSGLAQGAFSRGMGGVIANARAFGSSVSVPQGYNSPAALCLPVKTNGNIASRVKGESTFTASLRGAGQLSATLTGEAFIDANANVGLNGYATFAGEATLEADASAIGYLAAKMDILARPSAFDIAQEVWNSRAADYSSAGTLAEKVASSEKAAKLAAALSA